MFINITLVIRDRALKLIYTTVTAINIVKVEILSYLYDSTNRLWFNTNHNTHKRTIKATNSL